MQIRERVDSRKQEQHSQENGYYPITGRIQMKYNMIEMFKNTIRKAILFIATTLFITNSAIADDYFYTIASTQECGDLHQGIITGNLLKKNHGASTLEWNCNYCEVETEILLKRTATNHSNKILLDTLETFEIKCITPTDTFILNQYTSLKSMGIAKYMLIKYPITLTFDENDKPYALYIGETKKRIVPSAPTIIRKSGSDVFFCRGELHSFEASLPQGVPESEAYYRWYIDDIEMTGRNDRWFDTYSRTTWEDGEHYITCDVSIGKNGPRSKKGTYRIIQLPGSDCSFSIKAFPYWGADCVDDLSSSDFRYNEKSQWGSFVVSPIEDYVHYYMEVINKKILTSTITNDPHITDFQLVNKSEADVDYAFFLLPVNLKIHAKEPYMPRTVYFKIEGTNINFSMIPYITPTISVTPDSASVCERSFSDDTVEESLYCNATGFTDNEYSVSWFYSKTENGTYRLLKKQNDKKMTPKRVGYYKAFATDGVFDIWSKPIHVGKRSDNCISVMIKSANDEDFCCKNGTLKLSAFPMGENYRFQWYKGTVAGENMKKVENGTRREYKATISKPGEAYFVLVMKNGEAVMSDPFVVKERPSISNSKLEIASFPTTVCPGRSVDLVATLGDGKQRKDNLEYLFEWHRVSNGKNEVIAEISSSILSVEHSEIVKNENEFYVVVKGCDGSIKSEKNAVVHLNKDEKICSSGNFYVKTSGNDRQDGSNWEKAYASISKAVKAANEFRQIPAYMGKEIKIHVAAGTYLPKDDQSPNAYEIPSHTTIFGGYAEAPSDHDNIFNGGRKPYSPTHPDANATILKSSSGDQRIFSVKNSDDVKLIGLKLDGESVLKKANIGGRALLIENSEVSIDSCTITGFHAEKLSEKPMTAISLLRCNEHRKNLVNITNTSFTSNSGGQIGSCVGIESEGEINIKNCTFSNNNTQYYGGVAVLSYNASPTVNIYNSTFLDNTCPEGFGYHGRSVLRMVGANPRFNIYSCTISDQFYKEDGSLKIYNSIVECAGKADVYENNFPNVSEFSEASMNSRLSNLKFLSNFKGYGMNKLQKTDGFTMVMIPTNKIGIIGKAGAPNPKALTDQRGHVRNNLSCTFGAYEEDFTAIKTTDYQCKNGETKASFTSDVCGLTEVKFQWVNNYMDIEGANRKELNQVGLGTYWLEATGENNEGRKVMIKSNEIRISDICTEPGVFYVKGKDNGGDDKNTGMTWNQPFETLEAAIEAANAFVQKNKGKSSTIYVAAGHFTPSEKINSLCAAANKVSIYGSFPEDAVKGDKALQMKNDTETFKTKVSQKKTKIKWGKITVADIFLED